MPPARSGNQRLRPLSRSRCSFIPIITPTVVGSQYCRFELEAFLAREAALGRDDLVFPILYIRVLALEDSAHLQKDPVLSIIAKRQYVDWREFRTPGRQLDGGQRGGRTFVCQHLRCAAPAIAIAGRREGSGGSRGSATSRGRAETPGSGSPRPQAGSSPTQGGARARARGRRAAQVRNGGGAAHSQVRAMESGKRAP